MTEHEAFKVVRKNGRALAGVPYKLRTLELCREAVRQNGLALKHAPCELRTLELCGEAVRQDCRALFYVPDELRGRVEAAARRDSTEADFNKEENHIERRD